MTGDNVFHVLSEGYVCSFSELKLPEYLFWHLQLSFKLQKAKKEIACAQ